MAMIYRALSSEKWLKIDKKSDNSSQLSSLKAKNES